MCGVSGSLPSPFICYCGRAGWVRAVFGAGRLSNAYARGPATMRRSLERFHPTNTAIGEAIGEYKNTKIQALVQRGAG